MKTSVFIAVSLDGFIAREDGALDWLPQPEAASEEPEADDLGYQAFMDSVDGLVMGRYTYETVSAFGQWPYGDKPVIVLSSRSLTIPSDLAATVEHSAASPPALVATLAARGMRHLYIDGGKTIQRFLDAGLISQFIITVIPVLIGRGIPLFGPLARDVPLRHVRTTTAAGGLVQSTYVVRSEPALR